MKRFRLFGIILGLLVFTKGLQAQFTLSGEVRPRTEYRQGFKTLYDNNLEPALFTEQRTRIYFGYSDDKLSTKIALQDVRIWGSTAQIYKSDPSLSNLNEAYASYKFKPGFILSAGRMELNYDNARFLGNLGWAQQSRSHDLVKIVIADSTWQLHGGIAFNQDAETPEFKKLTSTFYNLGSANYKTMQFLWFHKDFESLTVSLLGLNNGVQIGTADTSDIIYSQTLGTFTTVKTGKIKTTMEAYYQTGENLSAYLIGLGLTFTGISKIPITIGYDRLSGTGDSGTKNKSFTPLYGTNHKFYGFMDYFYVGNAHSKVGLQDIYAKFTGKLAEKSTVLLHLHQFLSAVAVPDVTNGGNMSSALGTEIDLVFNQNFSKTTNLKIGFSKMFATSTMEVVKPGNGTSDAANIWGWAMLTFKPVFLNGK